MNDLLELKSALSEQHIELVHIVVFDKNHCIGKRHSFTWFLPEVVQHFKALTSGGVIVMGRNTFEAIGQPLSNRTNWVISSDEGWEVDGIHIAHSLEDALWFASEDVRQSEQASCLFILGGEEVFEQTLDIADRLETVRLDLSINGDVFYPEIPEQFRLFKQKHGVSLQQSIHYHFETYRVLPNSE